MRNMRKITSILLALCMLTAFAGCSQENSNTESTSAAEVSAEDNASASEAEDSANESDAENSDTDDADSSETAETSSASNEDNSSENVDREEQSVDSVDNDSNDNDSNGDASSAVRESESPYQLTYETNIPADLAETIAQYFYAIDTQNYDLYLAQVNPTYQTAMESLLQEQYGYGIEVDFEQYHQRLIDYAGTEDYTITSINMALAEEALAENFEEGTDFIGEYLDAYAEALGDDFVTTLQNESSSIYDIALTMLGEDGDGNAITIMDQLEILVVEATDGTFSVLG